MTRAAAIAALPLEGLPDIPCVATGVTTKPDRCGWVDQQQCTLPAGHEDRDVGHRWRWVSWQTAVIDDDYEAF